MWRIGQRFCLRGCSSAEGWRCVCRVTVSQCVNLGRMMRIGGARSGSCCRRLGLCYARVEQGLVVRLQTRFACGPGVVELAAQGAAVRRKRVGRSAWKRCA